MVFPNLRVAPPSVAQLADVPPECDIILKLTMGDSNTTLSDAVRAFEPDINILLVRHPASIAQTLQPAPRAPFQKNRPGDLVPRETLLRRLEWTWAMSALQWDAVILFEEILFNPAVRALIKSVTYTPCSIYLVGRQRGPFVVEMDRV
jgi:hypothetical protein